MESDFQGMAVFQSGRRGTRVGSESKRLDMASILVAVP